MEAIMAAMVARWNAAGLNTSIALLFPAGESRSSSRANGGSPEGTELPRAEYSVQIPGPSVQSRNSRIHQAVAEIKVWGTSARTVAGFVTTIRAAFVNCDAAATSPMTMAGGDILKVDDAGSFTIKVNDNLHLGHQMLTILHRLNNSTPG